MHGHDDHMTLSPWCCVDDCDRHVCAICICYVHDDLCAYYTYGASYAVDVHDLRVHVSLSYVLSYVTFCAHDGPHHRKQHAHSYSLYHDRCQPQQPLAQQVCLPATMLPVLLP
jgi:hypothetical protein